MVIGADGANSRVAKEIDAGEYDYAIAFQERIRIPDDKMDYYKDLAEMYVGDDVSPDFYGWVFPKYDHVAVGTGTVVNKTAIKKYQQATRDRSKVCMHLLHNLNSHIPFVRSCILSCTINNGWTSLCQGFLPLQPYLQANLCNHYNTHSL